jgi:hypothetical protein
MASDIRLAIAPNFTKGPPCEVKDLAAPVSLVANLHSVPAGHLPWRGPFAKYIVVFLKYTIAGCSIRTRVELE